jgi:LytS/YehU family sensor histidine kinase
MAELEQMALRSQINPHFIFNCLNSIQQYVIYKDVPGANDFISKFSHLIRTTLKISTCEIINLEEEIDYIRTYISVEKKRFDNKFNYEIVVGSEVDVNRCYIPPMILQPYIENAIRHGIGLRKDNLGKLEVRMEHRQGYLACVIEDNGVGRKVAAQFKSRNAISYQSVGMSLVARRIEMYNKQAGRQSARIHIEDLVDHAGVGTGTRVSIMFPLDLVLM